MHSIEPSVHSPLVAAVQSAAQSHMATDHAARIPSYDGSVAMKRITAVLKDRGPLDAREIAAIAFVSYTTLTGGGYLAELKRLGKIHVADWRKASNGSLVAVFGFGPGADAEKPAPSIFDRDSAGMARIVAALKLLGEMSYREAALAANLSPTTVRNARYMEILCEQKRIHISAWRRNPQGPMLPLFSAGQGENAERPTAYSGAEKSRRYRIKRLIATGQLGGQSAVRSIVRSMHARCP